MLQKHVSSIQIATTHNTYTDTETHMNSPASTRAIVCDCILNVFDVEVKSIALHREPRVRCSSCSCFFVFFSGLALSFVCYLFRFFFVCIKSSPPPFNRMLNDRKLYYYNIYTYFVSEIVHYVSVRDFNRICYCLLCPQNNIIPNIQTLLKTHKPTNTNST